MVDRDIYGTKENNGLEDAQAYHQHHHDHDIGDLDWRSPRLKRITRLRMVSDPGFPVWDITYCHGETTDGYTCEVRLPFSQLPKKGMRRAIVQHAKNDGVYAHGLGVFAAISTLQ